MKTVRELGLHEKAYILAGVTPPKSVGMARYMKKFVPGMDVTDEVIKRMQGAKNKKQEGINICVDIINQVKEIPGVAGVHVMAIEWEEAVPEICEKAGLLPRPTFAEAEAEAVLAPAAGKPLRSALMLVPPLTGKSRGRTDDCRCPRGRSMAEHPPAGVPDVTVQHNGNCCRCGKR